MSYATRQIYVILHESNITDRLSSMFYHHLCTIHLSSIICYLSHVTRHTYICVYIYIYIYTEKYVTSNANLSYIYCNNMHVTCTLQLYYYITKHPQALQPGDIFFFQVTKPARKLAASFRSGYRQGFLQTLLRESKKILHTIVLNLTQVQSLV